MKVEYLNDLNNAQKEAVINTEGPALVIAGAGSGKTRVLTYRIAHLLQKGIDASSILALTFTNKAAKEMKTRIINIAGYNNSRYLWMGTFHSIFARILRTESARLGYPATYTIYDSSDSRSLIKMIIKELALDDKIYRPAGVAARISSAKNNLITASVYASNEAIAERDRISKMPMMPEIYLKYASRCYKSGAMDFDDLLLNTNILFRDFPDTLNEYRKKFDYVLVDEYQDTNYSQYLIVKKLSESHRNLCVVGDDAQSIYSFRGARIENILNFRNDYPDCKLYKLEQNYRSTQTIVNAANSVIHKNRDQIKKTVYSKKAVGEKIRVLESMTDAEEGFKVGSDIFVRRLSQKLKWEDFAVLYRTNAQSRIFEETFRKKNIPYKIYGGLSFYERKEIKDILSYFRMIINPNDEEALRRTINYPKRGIGKTTTDRIFEAAANSEHSAWTVINTASSFKNLLTPATWSRISVYSKLIEKMTSACSNMNAYEAAKNISTETGIHRELKDGQTPEEISRYENLHELLNSIKEFTESAETNGEPSSLPSYLESVALLTDQDNENEEDRDKVSLMTAHSAKGLEFSHVYIVGLEENLFPSMMAMADKRGIEEERRLFYVALTRAMDQVTLSYAQNRYKWGNLESCKESIFLSEIDDEHLSFIKKTGFGARQKPIRDISEKRSTYPTQPERKLRRIRPASSEQYQAASDQKAEELCEGDSVIHERFGEGIIMAIEGDAPNTTAKVDFKKSGERKLLLRFAKLKIIK